MVALQVDDVDATRATLEEHGIEFRGGILDSGVCHQAFFADPDGNLLALHHRYAPEGRSAGVDDPEQLGLGLAEVAPAGDERAVGDQHLAVADRGRLAADLDLHEAAGDGDDGPAGTDAGDRRAGLARAEVDEVDVEVRRAPSSETVCSKPSCGSSVAAADAVDARVLTAQEVVDRHAERAAEAHQGGEREAAVAALDLRDRAGGDAREVAELVLAELARPPDGPQRRGHPAD